MNWAVAASRDRLVQVCVLLFVVTYAAASCHFQAPAAAYVWLFEAHYARYGAYPFVQCYTWAVDCYQQRAHLVVGVFGRHRPLLVAPHTEGYGAGVGLWPLLLPGAVADLLWPLAPRRAAPPR